MYQRVPRYPPIHARLVRREEGPPMYRMLGYADKNNQHSDLCDPISAGYFGPFTEPRLRPNQQVHFGPGRFGLPSQPLPFTTSYWDDRVADCDLYCMQTQQNRMHSSRVPHERPEAVIFPEMAVPGSGMHSKFRNSGYQWKANLPPPQSYCDPNTQWNILNVSEGQLPM